jgi:hypothetical protein
MSSNQKHSSLGWTLAISLGIACSAGVVHASSIGDNYLPGDTLTAAKMDNIKAAVNGNATDIGTLTTTVGGHTTSISTLTTTVSGHTTSIGTLTTSVTNLQTGAGTCVTNNASDEMVRVGPICVDKYPASLWDGNTAGAAAVTAIPGGCATDGTGCSGIYAQSRATSGTALKDGTTITWAHAARACANAGKRLLAPGEWMMARSFGNSVLSGDGMFTDTYSEWVDSVQMITDIMGVGRMGPNIGSAASGVVGYQTVDRFFELPGATVGFRCAR